MKLNRNKNKPIICPTARIKEQYKKHLFMKTLWEEEVEKNPLLLELEFDEPHFFIVN